MPKANQQPRSASPAPWNTNLPEVVDPRWILKALAAMLGLGLICAYISVCSLFYIGQWQLVLHPAHDVPATPASVGLAFTDIRFGVDASGEPQLSGWWIPADLPADPTALMLHSGDGSMSNSLHAALTLHNAGLNVLLFDYRGYGRSGPHHPSESLMQEDAASAMTYLTSTRSLPASSVLVYGTGVGASLAVRLCADHKDSAAIILETPDGDLQHRISADIHSRIIPVSLLFHENFPLAGPLGNLATPKLLISHTGAAPAEFKDAADPKMTVELPADSDAALHATLTRFISSYVGQGPAHLSAP